MATSPRVLRENEVEEQADYLEAVAEILRRIQREALGYDGKSPITLYEIADTIGVSVGTISNAANKKSVLTALYLKRLGKHFGPHMLDPYAALSGARMVPLQPIDRKDVLVFLTRATAKIAAARDRDSPGGEREIHTERFGYVDDLRDVIREATALVTEIEAERERMRA